MDGDLSRMSGILRHDKDNRVEMKGQVDKYTDLFDNQDADARKKDYTTVVNHYYDLATDFYEFGWGHSFHFAPRHRWEALDSSIARHEMWLANRAGFNSNMKIIDIGCGVGGPLRTIAKFTGAKMTGLNNNAYQISRGERMIKAAGLAEKANFVKGDFMHIPLESETYDGAYAIEATCHAPDRVGVFTEIFRLLKPGGVFVTYEWCLTDKYDPNNPAHVSQKLGIEKGNGLPDLELISTVVDALKKAGFEVEEYFDVAPNSDIPWYYPLTGRLTPTGFFHTTIGKWIAHHGLQLLETLKVAPAGSATTLKVLQDGGTSLVDAAKSEIFSPMWWIKARKPQNK